MPPSPSLFKKVNHVYPFAVVPLVGARIACRFLSSQAQDLHLKKNISAGGYVVSTTETSIKGARERSATQSPNGSTVMPRQCDLRRTVAMDEANQTYLLTDDPQNENAAAGPAELACRKSEV